MRGEVKQKKKKNSGKRYVLEIELQIPPYSPLEEKSKGGFIIFMICG